MPAPWIAFDAAAPSNAAKQRPVLVAACREPRVDPGDGQRPEIQHGAPAFLIGFRRADGRRGEALQPKAELDGRGRDRPRERGVEAFEGGGIGPLGVCCNRGGDETGNGSGRRGERRNP